MPEDKPKKQTKRYNDRELSLLKNTFSDNEPLLKAMRRVFLQMTLNANDLSLLSVNFNGKKDLLDVVRKTFLPKLDGDAPLGQELDLWMTIQIVDKLPEHAISHLEARQTLINYIDQQLVVLGKLAESAKEYAGKIDFDSLAVIEDKSAEQAFSDMVARNTMINHTDQQLLQLQFLANSVEETPEEAKEREQKNSTK